MSEEENYYACLYCGATFDTEEERDNHTFEKHMTEVEEKLSQIRTIAEEHSETIQEWKDAKRKELLLKIATERPQLLHEIQTSVHGSEILDHEVEMELLRKALSTNSLDSFSAMWIRHPKFEEIYKASREKPEHEPQTGDSTGQSEQTIEMPESPEAKKVLERETPVNKVSFRDGRLIIHPLSKDAKGMSLESLSDKDKSLLILYSLMRRKRKD